MTDRNHTQPRQSALPPSLPPRGLQRVAAAEYIGVSPTTFDEMVDDGRMPPPKAINRRRVWDRRQLDVAFDGLEEVVPAAGKPLAAPADDLPGWEDI